MRLWDYRLISYLPKQQLVAQWRELNSIYKKQDKHILINYIYDYSKYSLMVYSQYVINEMKKRGYAIKSFENYNKYFENVDTINLERFVEMKCNPYPAHHTERYLKQCFFNLQEKYDRGQKGFTEKVYEELLNYICEENY